ncbi:hypothetical protein GCM10010266_16870 [Streptomyces griseomycini]|nr:hypothetical protein GCM10010266_16870 [Streptomyces griseomycini]GGR30513.1 hypothetical protein GCM10015536_40090 [Streptomyces griseomycini]
METVSVTSGRMTPVADGTQHPVEAGRTAAFDGDTPRTYRGAGSGTCHLIMTVHLPPGPAATAWSARRTSPDAGDPDGGRAGAGPTTDAGRRSGAASTRGRAKKTAPGPSGRRARRTADRVRSGRHCKQGNCSSKGVIHDQAFLVSQKILSIWAM